MRYLFDAGDLRVGPGETNVMVYGFAKGETGHGDVRLVVPKQPASQIGELVREAKRQMPADGDVVLLEWPTSESPTFRLSLLESRSRLAAEGVRQFEEAAKKNQLVGRGACWLSPGLSPSW